MGTGELTFSEGREGQRCSNVILEEEEDTESREQRK